MSSWRSSHVLFRYSPLDLRLDPLENKEHQEIIQNQSNLGQKTLVKGCGGKHSKTSKNVILLIEDIPFVNNVDQSNQVHRILQQLLTRSASPVVFILPPSESGDRAAIAPHVKLASSAMERRNGAADHRPFLFSTVCHAS